jgi:hypothetical protein
MELHILLPIGAKGGWSHLHQRSYSINKKEKEITMKISSSKLIIVMMAILLMLGGMTSPIAAKGQIDKEQEAMAVETLMNQLGYSEEEAKQAHRDSLIVSENLKTTKSGVIYLDEKSALKDGLAQAKVDRTVSDLSKFKEKTGKALNTNDIGTFAQAAGQTCHGDSLWNSYSSRAFFDTCETSEIVWQLSIYAAIYTIAGLVTTFIYPPAGVATSIAGVLVGLSAAYVNYKDKGCGIFVYWSGPHTGVHSQTLCPNY